LSNRIWGCSGPTVIEAVSNGKKAPVTILGFISVSQRKAWFVTDAFDAQDAEKLEKNARAA
jgi:hypothetical protein